MWAEFITNWSVILAAHFMFGVGWLWACVFGVLAATVVYFMMGSNNSGPNTESEFLSGHGAPPPGYYQ